jgi:hypothetical protein
MRFLGLLISDRASGGPMVDVHEFHELRELGGWPLPIGEGDGASDD